VVHGGTQVRARAAACTLISTPFVLRIFQSEINAQVAVIHQKSYSAFLQQQQSSQVAAQVTLYKGELQQLNTVITSHGAATGNTAADRCLSRTTSS